MPIESKLEEEVAAFGGLSRDELAVRWAKQYSCQPPSGIRRDLLLRSAAWHLQIQRLGGTSSETKRLLAAAIRKLDTEYKTKNAIGPESTASDQVLAASGIPSDDRKAGTKPIRPRLALLPGSRLLRDWNGRTHVVDVIDGGFLFENKAYRSLSAIACQITGAHWSGPRFFGL